MHVTFAHQMAYRHLHADKNLFHALFLRNYFNFPLFWRVKSLGRRPNLNEKRAIDDSRPSRHPQDLLGSFWRNFDDISNLWFWLDPLVNFLVLWPDSLLRWEVFSGDRPIYDNKNFARFLLIFDDYFGALVIENSLKPKLVINQWLSAFLL